MAMTFSPISEISTARESWSVLAKIVRLWVVSDFSKHKIPFSIEMVLMDEQGVKIHATVRRTLLYKFQSELKKGSVYSLQFLTVAANVGSYRTCKHEHKLIFQISSKVQIMEIGRVSGDGYDLVPIHEIFGGGYDMDYLVDVIGMLYGVGSEREYERNGSKTKLNVISLEVDGHKIECTLFGSFVDELNSFLASGDLDNVVVIVQFAKEKTFQEKIHLQNCMTCTKVIFNPNCEAAVNLKKRMIATIKSPSQGISQLCESVKISVEEEFLELTPRTTVLGLKSCIEHSGNHYIPKPISDLVGNTFLFKVEYKHKGNNQFEQSFAVKKVCTDVAMINKFVEIIQKPLYGSSDSGSDGPGSGRSIEGGPSDISEDLLPKFSSALNDASPQSAETKNAGVKGCGGESSMLNKGKAHVKNGDESPDKDITPSNPVSTTQLTIDLSSDTDKLTLVKRVSPTNKINTDLELPLKMLKKNIKIEK